MAVIALAMAGGGCGGGSGRASEEEIVQVRARLRKKAEQEGKEAAEAKKKAAAEKAGRAKEVAAKLAKQRAAQLARQKAARLARQKGKNPEKPVLPEDVAAWKEKDYLNAGADGDPRLLEAVAFLGRRRAGHQDAGELLTRLLQREGKAGTDRGRRGKTVSAETEAILAALAANGTARTRKTLLQIVTGELAINGRNGAQAAVQALARHPTPETESILYRALTQSSGVQMPGSGKTAASGFESMILAAVRPEAAEQFRVRLAEHIVDPGTSDALRERLGGLIEEPRVENLAAQMLIYRRFQTSQSTKTRLSEYFTAYGSETLRRLLGVPERALDGSWSAGLRGSGGSDNADRAAAHKAAEADPSLPTRAAAHLWSSRFAAHLADRLYHLDSLDQQAPLVLLAGTIPLDSVRSRVYATLERNWQDGPGALRSAGLPARVISDPGLIVLVKMLPHEAFGAGRGRKPSRSRNSASRNFVQGNIREAQMQREKVKGDWARFCGELVLATSKRLEMASHARAAAAARPSGGTADNPPALRLPLALHESARVVASYRTVWPEDVRSRVSGASLDSMEINYVRMEETNRFRKLLAYYKRQMGTRRESGDRQGVWLETVRDLPGTGRKLSLDVIIRKAMKGSAYETLDEDEKLAVEILAIEIRDPRAVANGPVHEPATGRVAAEPGG